MITPSIEPNINEKIIESSDIRTIDLANYANTILNDIGYVIVVEQYYIDKGGNIVLRQELSEIETKLPALSVFWKYRGRFHHYMELR